MYLGAQIVLGLAASLIVLVALYHGFGKGSLPRNWGQSLIEFVLVLPVAILLIAVFLYGIGRLLAVTASREGLSGPSVLGKQIYAPWQTIERVTRTSFHGVPALHIWSAGSKRAITIFTFGLDPAETRAQLAAFVGTNHIVSRCFADPESGRR